MNFIWCDSSTNDICTIIGFYFQGENNLKHTKTLKINLKVNRSCTVEAEFKAILFAVDFIRLSIDKYPNIAAQRFTILTDCKTTNDTIHNTPNQRKLKYCIELLKEFRSKVNGLNISVAKISRDSNKAHKIVYNESRRHYNSYIQSIRIKGDNQSSNLVEAKRIESQWNRYLQL